MTLPILSGKEKMLLAGLTGSGMERVGKLLAVMGRAIV